jgi:hypothetical protein
MDGTADDYLALLDHIKKLPDKNSRRITWTSEKDWLLWEFYDRKNKKELARAFRVSDRYLYVRHLELAEQGGPKGEKPTWLA